MSFSHELCESECPYVSSYNKKKLIIPIDHEFKEFQNIGVTRQLLSMRHKYDQELRGILLDWQIYKIRLDTDSQPPMKARYSVKGNWKILRIPEMERLEARIVNTGKGLLTAIWFDTVPVRIKGSFKDYPVGGDISFDYSKFTDEDGFPVMEGTNAVLIHQNGINGELNGNPSETESEVPTSPRVSKSTSQKRKHESDSEQSPRKTPKIVNNQAEKKKSQDKVDESANSDSAASTSTPMSTNKKTPNRRLVSDATKTPKSQNDLPPGYSRVAHTSEKTGKTWYSFSTPDGKPLKSRKLVDEHYHKHKGSGDDVKENGKVDDDDSSDLSDADDDETKKEKPSDKSFSKTLGTIIASSSSKKAKEHKNPEPDDFSSALGKILEEAQSDESSDESTTAATVAVTAAATSARTAVATAAAAAVTAAALDLNESMEMDFDESVQESAERVNEVVKMKKKKKKRKESYKNVPGFS